MVSTGIYTRVSTEEQAKEGYSIRAQEEKLWQYAALKGWHIYSVYSDEGISGKDIEGRPAIKQLIADVESGKINNVLVYKIDRLTRSTKNLIDLVDLFNDNDCAFNSLVESIDTASATGRMFLKIVGIFAEFERENLAERVRLGMERKVKEGYAIMSFITSYGYDRENGTKIPTVNAEEAVIVRRIFNMYLHDDYSLKQICRTLNAEQIPSKKGVKWCDSSVKGILTNVIYIGKVRYSVNDASRYFETEGQHEAILDEALFYQVQEKINRLQRVAPTKRPGSAVYYCGVLRCPVCGGKYTTKWQSAPLATGGTGHYASYICRNYHYENGACTAKVTFSHLKVDKAFEEYIGRVDVTAQDIETEPLPDNSAEINAITADIKTIEKRTEEIMGLYVVASIDFETYQGMVRQSNERRGELTARLQYLENAQKANLPVYSAKEIVADIRASWAALDNEKRLQFVQQFIKRIVVTKNGRDVVVQDMEFNQF